MKTLLRSLLILSLGFSFSSSLVAGRKKKKGSSSSRINGRRTADSQDPVKCLLSLLEARFEENTVVKAKAVALREAFLDLKRLEGTKSGKKARHAFKALTSSHEDFISQIDMNANWENGKGAVICGFIEGKSLGDYFSEAE